jgi:hypothetical protein
MYTLDILKNFNMMSCKEVATSLGNNLKLQRNDYTNLVDNMFISSIGLKFDLPNYNLTRYISCSLHGFNIYVRSLGDTLERN